MKEFKSPHKLFAKLAVILGAAFLVVCACSMIWHFVFGGLVVALTLWIVFGVNGAMWLILGLCFFMYAQRASLKLERLKNDGIHYDAEVTGILHSKYMRIGGYLTVYAECTYRSNEGKTCLVKSNSFLLDRLYGKEQLNASVYVSRNDPRDYAIEVRAISDTTVKVDYDYR